MIYRKIEYLNVNRVICIGYKDVVRLLVKYGADVNTSYAENEPPLILAVMAGECTLMIL